MGNILFKSEDVVGGMEMVNGLKWHIFCSKTDALNVLYFNQLMFLLFCTVIKNFWEQ